jgi:hypothetical protein
MGSRRRGTNGSAHGHASLAAKRERYESELAAKSPPAKIPRGEPKADSLRERTDRGKPR